MLILLSQYENVEVGPRRWYSKWWWLLWLLFIALILLTRSFLYEPFRIPSSAMSPSLIRGDNVVVSKKGYGNYGTLGFMLIDSEPSKSLQYNRGRMYAFKHAPHNVIYLKRLIGLPGDTVEIKASQLYVNGNKVPREFISAGDTGYIFQETLDGISYQITKSHAFKQTRDFKTTVPIGQYFFLGDNRDNSADSRFYGSVDKNQIIGHVALVIRP